MTFGFAYFIWWETITSRFFINWLFTILKLKQTLHLNKLLYLVYIHGKFVTTNRSGHFYTVCMPLNRFLVAKI